MSNELTITLQQEAIRLADATVVVLQDMQQRPGVLVEDIEEEGNTQTLTPHGAADWIDRLQGEKGKLQDLELVIAVVGTMKAGKSTTINAIVGADVLPNRNRPMTSMPTLIRHTPGQREPMLEFKNTKPTKVLTKAIQKALKAAVHRDLVQRLHDDTVMSEVVAAVSAGRELPQHCSGPEAIFEFLRELNDLVRLGKEFGLELDLDEYRDREDFPTINVEFTHLRGVAARAGRIALLDTPGHNEANSVLREVVEEQLKRASAVLAVFDYTQLNSEADGEVREWLMEISERSEGRMYAVVNKFDQKDSKSDGADVVCKLVAEKLMEGELSVDRVFPVSSRKAFLANRMLGLLDTGSELPDEIVSDAHKWIEDFCTVAGIRKWSRARGNLEELREVAEEVWEESLFDTPLDRVITAGHRKAAMMTIAAAADQVADCTKDINNVLSVRHTALSKSVKELQEHIAGLFRDIEALGQAQKTGKQMAAKLLKQFDKELDICTQQVRSGIDAEFKYFFEQGKRLEQKEMLAQQEAEVQRGSAQKSPLHELFATLFAPQRRITTPQKTFNAGDACIEFSNQADAARLVNNIGKNVDAIIDERMKALSQTMDVALNLFQEKFQGGILSEVNALTEGIRSRLKEGGIELALDVPDVKRMKLPLSGSQLLSGALDHQQQTVTGSRRQDGVTGSIKRGFGWLFRQADWGYDDVQVTKDVYVVDIPKIKRRTEKAMKAAFDGLGTTMAESVKTPLNERIDDFFGQLTRKLEGLRGDLAQGIRDKQGSEVEQQALAENLKSLKKNAQHLQRDAAELAADANRPVATALDASSELSA